MTQTFCVNMKGNSLRFFSFRTRDSVESLNIFVITLKMAWEHMSYISISSFFSCNFYALFTAACLS